MRILRRTLALTLALALAVSAAALATGPLNGKTYKGGTTSTGLDLEGHQQPLGETGAISLRVSHSGRFVTVVFPSSHPILYCQTGQPLYSQTTKAAQIHGDGSFRASIDERFGPGTGKPAIVQVVAGRFSGRTAKGTIHTEAAECSGRTSFRATAR
jgi:hypothetical protein